MAARKRQAVNGYVPEVGDIVVVVSGPSGWFTPGTIYQTPLRWISNPITRFDERRPFCVRRATPEEEALWRLGAEGGVYPPKPGFAQ